MGANQTRAAAACLRQAVAIVGCGYLGERLARVRPAVPILATCRGSDRLRQLGGRGYRALQFDVAQPADTQRLIEFLAETTTHLFYLVPPGVRAARSEDAVRAFERVASALAEVGACRAVMASSTAVYGDQGRGEIVSADTVAAPTDGRGRALLAMEELWLEKVPHARAVRLAGLYGPGRVIGRHALETGQAVEGDPDAWLNLVHVDDAARLLDAVAHSDTAARIELGADGRPLRRREYYDALGRILETPVTYAPDPNPRGSRRCDIGPTVARTGWTPELTDFRAAIQRALAVTG